MSLFAAVLMWRAKLVTLYQSSPWLTSLLLDGNLFRLFPGAITNKSTSHSFLLDTLNVPKLSEYSALHVVIFKTKETEMSTPSNQINPNLATQNCINSNHEHQ